MGLIDNARRMTIIKGYDYYKNSKVQDLKTIGINVFSARVSGGCAYDVIINTDHPRSSSCTCPFAYGTRKICKHMIATYFTVFPNEAEKYKNLQLYDDCDEDFYDFDDYEEDYAEDYYRHHYDGYDDYTYINDEDIMCKVLSKIENMNKSDLKSTLFEILSESSDETIENFLGDETID